MQKLLKISQQTIWQVVVKLITTISGFVILGTVARNYGEAGTGSFTLALTYLAFFYILVDFGFNAHVLERLQVTGTRQQESWRKLLGARIIWSTVLIVVALMLLPLLPFYPPSLGPSTTSATLSTSSLGTGFSPDFKWAVILGTATILFFALNLTAQALFQAKLRYDLDIFPTIIGVSAGTLLIIWMALLGLSVYLLVLGYVLAWFLHSAGTLISTRKFIKFLSPIFDLNYTKQLFVGASPLAATLVLNVIYFRIDAFILSFYHPQAAVGVYNTAYQVFQAILVLPTFIMNSFYPMMLDTLKVKAERFFHQVKLAFTSLLAISIFLSLIIYLLAPIIIQIITSSGFVGSVDSLRILSYGFPAYFLSSLLMWVMVAKKMYKKMVMVYTLGLGFNLMANLIFIPGHSYIAASWITGISEYLILALQLASLLM